MRLDNAIGMGDPPGLKERISTLLLKMWQSQMTLRRADHILFCLNQQDRAYLESRMHVQSGRITRVFHERFVQDGINAILVSPGNAGQIVRAVEQLRLDADLRQRLGRRASQVASSRYIWRALGALVHQAYSNLLGS
jgi:hypothetical protein